MPNPTIFSVGLGGKPRLLFSVQERASGDLTIVVKHSKFATAEEGGKSTASDAVIQERYSVHRSVESNAVNVIKYTQIIKDGRANYTRNYTKAIKQYNRFAGIFIRRTGDLSDPRYIIASKPSISLGDYDPEHFQPVFLVCVGAADRNYADFFRGHIDHPPINHVQIRFRYFRIVVLWQFMMLNGETTSRSLSLKTFSETELESGPEHERTAMAAMSDGFDEIVAVSCFQDLKYRLLGALMEALWKRMTPDERYGHGPLYRALQATDPFGSKGLAFTDEHKLLLLRLGARAEQFRIVGTPPTYDPVNGNYEFHR